eukprot:gb/GECH01005805.1/.p1 GENE.gb/GECH01005805.1/~~gb/GECH01005805.1/.p1  ORF type:complete len:198 (+),score=40.51 gb/GECH01005805.1/:1-594(+)
MRNENILKRKRETNNTNNSNDVIEPQTKKRKIQRDFNLHQKLTNSFQKGPISLIRECYIDQSRIKVVIRRKHGIRGTCEGIIVAFDKHMNLILKDVKEIYNQVIFTQPSQEFLQNRPQPKSQPSIESFKKKLQEQSNLSKKQIKTKIKHFKQKQKRKANKRKNIVERKSIQKSRQLPQIFIKGDAVVCFMKNQSLQT